MAHDCFAQCSPGLEPLLAAELNALGIRPGRRDRGGVAFRASSRQLYAANMWLRTANRVVVRAAEFRARTWGALEAGAAQVAWEDFLGPDVVPAFRVTSSRSELYHTTAIAERLARLLGVAPPKAGQPESDEDTQLVVVRVAGDQVTLSIDSSGAALYKRGWRQAVAKAPLRETLAAAALLASGWDRQTPLIDPFCGSGTLLVEAALLARDLAPGTGRDFAFQRWPSHEPGTWASVRGEVASRARALPDGVVLRGSDRDAGAVAAATANAERAGVARDLELARASVSDLTTVGSRPGWLVTNPPYGGRASAGRDLRDLFARFGDVVRRRLAGWDVSLLVADTVLAGHAHLHLVERLQTSNGGIPVHLVGARVPGLAPCPDGEVAGEEVEHSPGG